jgi:hypothetical protein
MRGMIVSWSLMRSSDVVEADLIPIWKNIMEAESCAILTATPV